MPKMTFPLIQGKQRFYPTDFICPWCREKRIGEPRSMIIVNAGALHKTGENAYGPDAESIGFFSLIWHGAHAASPDDDDQTDEGHAVLDIADRITGGQFDLYCYSTDCLRGLLNHCVDELEWRIEKEKDRR